MSWLTDFFVVVLTVYLAVTNQIATQVLALLGTEPASPLAEEVMPAEETTALLPSLPSLYERSGLPDILLRSREYQRAVVIDGARTEPVYTTDPVAALVNIYCTFTTSEYIRTTTGTGFFVDPAGVIMTNAHVAQFLLLEATDALGEADCTIRTGNPATATYMAELLYLPPAWVQENASLIDAAVPVGTGERDYALLYVARHVDPQTPLPARFPSLAFDTDPLPRNSRGRTVQAVGYPALEGARGELIPHHATTSISELYTFGSNLADVFSIRGSSVGAQGSSGGPIVTEDGRVIGMIATRGDDARDGEGSLRAITLSHIHRTISEETGFSLERNVSGNIAYRGEIFKQTLAPFLLTLLTNELNN